MPKAKKYTMSHNAQQEKVKASKKAAQDRIDAVVAKSQKKPPKSVLLRVNSLELIRKVNMAGKKTVMIDNREFRIRRLKTKQGKHKVTYLVVSPVKGRYPTANIQAEKGPSKALKEWASRV